MSEVKRWEPRDTIVGFDMEPRKDGSFVLSCDYDAALSELAALREELALAKRNEHNSEVAYKAAIEKQEELREELKWTKAGAKAEADAGDEARKALTAAEQRNAELGELLRQSDDFMYIMTGNDTQKHLDAKYGAFMWEEAIDNLRGKIAASLKPTESGASG